MSAPAPTTHTRSTHTVVIGAGHNALVAACYLAASRHGHDVIVLERDSIPGGAVSTVERFPGYRVDRGSSAHIMIRHNGIVEELDLAAHGLEYAECDPWAFAPSPRSVHPHDLQSRTPSHGRPPIVFYRDLDATCDSIAAAAGAQDAQAYRRFVLDWTPKATAMMRSFGQSATAGHFVNSYSRLGSITGNNTLAHSFLMSGNSLLDTYFQDEPLKAALAWFGAQSGPGMEEPGTAAMVGFAALMHHIPPGRAIGGSGSLTAALVHKLQSHGGEILLDHSVHRIARKTGKWEVNCDNGTTIYADNVIAGCHINITLAALKAGGFDPDVIDDYTHRIRVGNGIGVAVRLGTTTLPRYDAPESVHHGMGLLVTDRRELALAHGEATAGILPSTPAVLAMGFSSLDPSLAPPDRHMMTLWSQWFPYHHQQPWDEQTHAAALSSVIAQVDRYAPGFSNTIEHSYLQTPPMLEQELGLIGGNVMHVDMSLDSMMTWRPIPELSAGRVPHAENLYLAGASMHPGGGVSGASGRIAATQLMNDERRRGLRRWRR